MTEKLMLCELCQTGHMIPVSETRMHTYKGQSKPYTSHFSECDCCGIISKTPEQDKNCLKAITSIRKSIDGLLSGSEIQHILNKYYITQTKASDLFGGGQNAFSKYIRDEIAQSKSIDNWLKVTDLMPEVILVLAKNNNVNLNEKTISVVKGKKEKNTDISIQIYMDAVRVETRALADQPRVLWPEKISNIHKTNKLNITKQDHHPRRVVRADLASFTTYMHGIPAIHATDIEEKADDFSEEKFTGIAHATSIMPHAKSN